MQGEIMSQRRDRRTSAGTEARRRIRFTEAPAKPQDTVADGARGELRLALIDSRSLVLSALSCFLETWAPANGHGSVRVLPFLSRREFLAECPDPGDHIDVVALNIGAASVGDRRIQDDVRELRHRIAGMPLVLMSDYVEALPGIEALLHGISGYIPTTVSPSIAIQALHLIHAGGTFVPTDVLLPEIGEHRRPPPAHAQPALVPNGLTARQHNVLELIRQGKSNKVIAASLDISESTVKVYVHQIMKKLGATNRTHACFLLSQAGQNDED